MTHGDDAFLSVERSNFSDARGIDYRSAGEDVFGSLQEYLKLYEIIWLSKHEIITGYKRMHG